MLLRSIYVSTGFNHSPHKFRSEYIVTPIRNSPTGILCIGLQMELERLLKGCTASDLHKSTCRIAKRSNVFIGSCAGSGKYRRIPAVEEVALRIVENNRATSTKTEYALDASS